MNQPIPSSNIRGFSYPVLRHGAILRAFKNYEPTDTKTIAEQIDANYSGWIDRFRASLTLVSDANQDIIENKKISWRSLKGYDSESADTMEVATLPIINLMLDEFVCDFRVCIFLGKSNRNTKIFYKVCCKEANGQPAAYISVESGLKFFQLVAELKEHIFNCINNQFNEELDILKLQRLRPLSYYTLAIYATNVEYCDKQISKADLSNIDIYDGQAKEVASSICGEKPNNINIVNRYSPNVRVNFHSKFSNKGVALTGCKYVSHIFDFQPKSSHDDISSIIICPNGYLTAKYGIIEQNKHIPNFSDVLKNNPNKITNFYAATGSNEASRQLLLNIEKDY